jgi:hypothetical protein
LQPASPSTLQPEDLTAGRTVADAISGINSGGPFLSFVPDGIGTFVMSAAVSDSCSTDTAFVTVPVGCPAPGPLADAGNAVTLRRSFILPNVTSPSNALINSTNLNLGRNALMALFGEVSLSATTSDSNAAYAWVFVSVPNGSAYLVSPAGLPEVDVADPFVLPPTVFSTTAEVRFVPDALGTFVLLLAASDGCSISTATVTVTAIIDTLLPPVDAVSNCILTPTPSPCAAVGSSSTTASITLTLRLNGIAANSFIASPDLQSSVMRSVADVCGVQQSAVQIIGVSAAPVLRALAAAVTPHTASHDIAHYQNRLVNGDSESELHSRRAAETIPESLVTIIVQLPSALSNSTHVQRIIAALESAALSGTLANSIAALGAAALLVSVVFSLLRCFWHC